LKHDGRVKAYRFGNLQKFDNIDAALTTLDVCNEWLSALQPRSYGLLTQAFGATLLRNKLRQSAVSG
jgi:hypothetical protein